MNTLNGLLTQEMLQNIILGMAFLSAALVVGGLSFWLTSIKRPIDRRLIEVTADSNSSEHIEHQEGAFNVKWMDPVAKIITPEEDWKKSRIKTRLTHAGYRKPSAMTVYLASKILMAIIFPLVFVLPLTISSAFGDDSAQVAILTIALALVGFFFPNVLLSQKIEERQRDLFEGFPDSLDLLVVCVESGLGLDGAIQKVAKEIEFSWPTLAEELLLVTLELRAGKARKEAFVSLADRTGLDDIQALTGILIQAEHFGTSIASALREHANEMRKVRIQRARERAAKLPVKMALPIVFFIFPALFLVILGPAAINIYTILINNN